MSLANSSLNEIFFLKCDRYAENISKKMLGSYKGSALFDSVPFSTETQSIDLKNGGLMSKKSNDKLTAISCLNSQGIINVQTFDKEMEVWTIAEQIFLWKMKTDFAIIVVEEKLIIVGGRINNVDTNSVECLDLHTFEWSALPSMRQSRRRSQLAYFKENLYVFGGFMNTSLEIYNFTTCEWRDLRLPFKSSQYSQIAAYNGILYIADFHNGYLHSFNVTTNQWILKALEKGEQIYNFGFAAVEGFLYKFGGYCSGYTNTVKRYNLADDSWSEMAPLPQSRHCMKTVVLGNKIVICAGIPYEDVVQEYDMNTDTWNTFNSNLVDFPVYRSLVDVLVTDLF